jgi:hypothetical protein
MSKFSLFVGIDVSKAWLDIAIVSQENILQKIDRIDNTIGAIRAYVKTLPPQTAGIPFSLRIQESMGTHFCMLLPPCI